jgi:hypothetical protein
LEYGGLDIEPLRGAQTKGSKKMSLVIEEKKSISYRSLLTRSS